MSRLLLSLALAVALSTTGLQAQTIDMAEVRAEEDFRWGLRAYHNGRFGDSVLSLEKSLGIKPDRVLTRLWLGNAFFRAGYVEAALREWRFVLGRAPGTGELKALTQIVGYRRGLGRELEPPSPFVVAQVIDGAKPGTYPLARPTAIHIRPDGSMYVSCFAGGAIVHLNVNSRVLEVLKGGVKGYNRPFHCLEVADPATGERSLFVSEYGANRIVRAALDGQERGNFGSTGSGPGMLLGPQYLAVDGRGYLYVSDWGNARVSKFDLAGNFILSMGTGRTLETPSGLAVLGDRVYVVDQGRARIAVFDDSGNFLYFIGEGRLNRPEGIVVRDPDTLLVSDANRILQYRLPEETWDTLSDLSMEAGRLTHLAFSPNGELYVADFDGNKIFVLSEMSELYSNLAVQIERIDSSRFPEITVEISAETRRGSPLVGLEATNFVLTEGNQGVSNPRLIRANTDPAPLEAILLVEKSIAMKGFERDAVEGAERLHGALGQRSGLQVVSAEERPRVAAAFGSSRLQVAEALRRPEWSPRWRFDLGVRMAASELIPRAHRKAVVYAGVGTLPPDAFADFSLVEVADYLKNNAIPFYVMYFGPELAPELGFLCSESGGEAHSYYAPAGLDSLLVGMRARTSSRYSLRYNSRSDGRFGMGYIELRAEVVLHRKSGRAASGYYAPLSD